jgi:hypothetical protein
VVDNEFLILGSAERAARIRLPRTFFVDITNLELTRGWPLKTSFFRRNFLDVPPIENMNQCVATTYHSDWISINSSLH